MEETNICALVRDRENKYTNTDTTLSKYVEFNQYENVNKIEAYLFSKHISGDVDAQGRDKPFFNIVTAATNIWYRATKVKKEAIKIRADKKTNTLSSFLATLHLHDWFKKSKFQNFIRDWSIALSRYGSSVTKWVERDGELIASIVSWNRIITDVVDFHKDVVIEKLELTPLELRMNKGYSQDVVENLIETAKSRTLLNGQRMDNKVNTITLYEVHGELPLSLLTGKDKDDDTYVQQMHVVSFLGNKGGKLDEYDEFTLVKGKEKKSPYLITHLIKEEGRTQAIGAIEHIFEAQWMVNHTAKAIKDQLDLASKLIFQTSDENYVGRNALNAIDTGDIMVHAPNMPITQVQNNSHDITSLQNFGNQWKVLSQEVSSTPDAIRGNTQPSGTAYRLQQLITTESHSLFDEMRDNKYMHLEDMAREFIIPFLKKKMDTTEEISSTLSEHDIKKIDSMYVSSEATRRVNKKVISKVLNDFDPSNPTKAMVSPYEQEVMTAQEAQGLKQQLGQMGKQRFIAPSDIPETTWKEALDGLEWEVEIDTPANQEDRDLTLTTLDSVFKTIANPNTAPVLATPKGKFLFNKILSLSGSVSPVELEQLDEEEMSQSQLATPATTT